MGPIPPVPPWSRDSRYATLASLNDEDFIIVLKVKIAAQN